MCDELGLLRLQWRNEVTDAGQNLGFKCGSMGGGDGIMHLGWATGADQNGGHAWRRSQSQ